MPGRIMDGAHGVDTSPKVKLENGEGQPGDASSPGGVDKGHAQLQDNSSKQSLPNGLSKLAVEPPVLNGVHANAHAEPLPKEPPPELDQSWRETPQNKSMATLLDRLAHHAYWDLNEALTKMAQLPKPPQTLQTNGATIATLDSSEESIERKRIILQYAKEQRDRFTKALVLSDWSRNEQDMARLIDIKQWQDMQRFAHANAKHAIGVIKRDTVQARMPNPNINGAMELLATNTAPWMPDMGYIPQKRLTSKQLLGMLRNMNVVLSTRLNLHDTLPATMKNFKVANGRATFTVREEFEVDLSVADEDPMSQFYFIDIRFLFTPSASSVHENIRGLLEGRVNERLASDGLQGCYDFLHNLVLTYKINALRTQAFDLTKDQWSGCLASESPRRSLVIRYWADRPGPKSWIEFGIDSGKTRAARSHKPPVPHISVKWYQKGTLTSTDSLQIDWRDLNLEKILGQVTAKHISTILESVKERTSTIAQNSAVLNLDLARDETNTDVALQLNITSIRAHLTVRIDHVTGCWSISPPTPATLHVERRLNNDASLNAAEMLATLAFAVAQETLMRQAELIGWTPAPNVRLQNVSEFGADVRRRVVFACPGWSKDLALVATLGFQGQRWWVIRRDQVDSVDVKREAPLIRSQQPSKYLLMPVGAEKQDSEPPSKRQLLAVEKRAVADVSLHLLSLELESALVPYHVEEEKVASRGSSRSEAPRPCTMFIRFSRLLLQFEPKEWSPWANDLLRLAHAGIDSSALAPGEEATVLHDVRLSLLTGKMQQLRQRLVERPNEDDDLRVNDGGGIALRFRTQFGKPILPALRQQLKTIERLDRYIAVLAKVGFKCKTVNLNELVFSYGPSFGLGARVTFGDEVKLKLAPDNNPHLRLSAIMEAPLRSPDPEVFEKVVFILWTSLPVMQALNKWQDAPGAPRIRVYALTRYALQYQAPHPRLVVHISLRKKHVGAKNKAFWAVQNATDQQTLKSFPDEFKSELGTFWAQPGDGWEALENAIIAEPRGVADALEKMDAIVRKFDGQAKTSTEGETSNGTAQAPVLVPVPSSNGTKHAPAPSKPAAPAAKNANRPPNKQPPPHDVITLD